ncbi:Uncharacterised protein [Yersinia enterocolitica]|nr:Uncharacterised protein [Yersinia enterocolitica]
MVRWLWLRQPRDGQKCVVVHAVATVVFWGLDVNAVLHAPGFPVREGLNVNEMIHAPSLPTLVAMQPPTALWRLVVSFGHYVN